MNSRKNSLSSFDNLSASKNSDDFAMTPTIQHTHGGEEAADCLAT